MARTLQRNLRRRAADPNVFQRRNFRRMDREELGLHILRHMLHRDEAWSQVEVQLEQWRADREFLVFLDAAHRALTGQPAPTPTRWRRVETECYGSGKGAQFRTFAKELVARFPRLAASYADSLDAAGVVAGVEPTHCVVAHSGREKEYYVDQHGVFVSMDADLDPGPDHTHVILTGIREQKGRLPEEKRRERLARIRRMESPTLYSEESWTES